MEPESAIVRNKLAMPKRGLYGITDDVLLPQSTLLPTVEAALENGLQLLQYRSKNPPSLQSMETLRELVELCESYAVPLLINDNAELCRAVGAHGVHLGQSDGSVTSARKILGDDAIIGVTCHSSLDTALIAQAESANYVAFGRFFPSVTKPNAAQAQARVLTSAREALTLPIVAIGGINAENGAQLLTAGADLLAVIHSLFGGGDVKLNTKKLVALFA